MNDNDRTYHSKISSNMKCIFTVENNENSLFSIDTGENGKLFTIHHDYLTESHEKGILFPIKSDSSRKFDMEFIKDN